MHYVDVSGTGRPPPFGEGTGLDHSVAFVGSNPTVYTIINNFIKHMTKALVFIFSLFSFNVHAFVDDPYAIRDASKNFTESSVVVWKVVKNASETCQKESKKRGFGGWQQKVYACTFWNENHGNPPACTIYTDRYTNMHQIGHELLHCFQGPYHD